MTQLFPYELRAEFDRRRPYPSVARFDWKDGDLVAKHRFLFEVANNADQIINTWNGRRHETGLYLTNMTGSSLERTDRHLVPIMPDWVRDELGYAYEWSLRIRDCGLYEDAVEHLQKRYKVIGAIIDHIDCCIAVYEGRAPAPDYYRTYNDVNGVLLR